jgi:retron-type reverse transcriptase
MIDKWLKAGVLEDGLLRHATEGSPQGGVISLCLSNIFLHHVLDEWFEAEVRPRLKGKCTLVRFADDAGADQSSLGHRLRAPRSRRATGRAVTAMASQHCGQKW